MKYFKEQVSCRGLDARLKGKSSSKKAKASRSRRTGFARDFGSIVAGTKPGGPTGLQHCGGMGRSSSVTFKRIAALLAEKTGLRYAATINVVRCRLSFALRLRSAITLEHCVVHDAVRQLPPVFSQLTLALAEARVPH